MHEMRNVYSDVPGETAGDRLDWSWEAVCSLLPVRPLYPLLLLSGSMPRRGHLPLHSVSRSPTSPFL